MPTDRYFSNLPVEPEAAATAVLSRTGIDRVPVDLDLLLRTLGDCERLEVALEGDGYLVPAGLLGPRAIIVVNKKAERWDKRHRFTIAHELGHLALSFNPDMVSLENEEAWCDSFANALLMPKTRVLEFRDQVKSLPDWLSFAGAFQVSLSAAANRLWHCCRVVIASDKVPSVSNDSTYLAALAELKNLIANVDQPGETSGYLRNNNPYVVLKRHSGGGVLAVAKLA